MKWLAPVALIAVFWPLTFADEPARIAIDWKDARPGDDLVVRSLGGREARGTSAIASPAATVNRSCSARSSSAAAK